MCHCRMLLQPAGHCLQLRCATRVTAICSVVCFWVQLRIAADEPDFTTDKPGGGGIPGSKARVLARLKEHGWDDAIKVHCCRPGFVVLEGLEYAGHHAGHCMLYCRGGPAASTPVVYKQLLALIRKPCCAVLCCAALRCTVLCWGCRRWRKLMSQPSLSAQHGTGCHSSPGQQRRGVWCSWATLPMQCTAVSDQSTCRSQHITPLATTWHAMPRLD
jgi:hypothetical protein